MRVSPENESYFIEQHLIYGATSIIHWAGDVEVSFLL